MLFLVIFILVLIYMLAVVMTIAILIYCFVLCLKVLLLNWVFRLQINFSGRGSILKTLAVKIEWNWLMSTLLKMQNASKIF
jgi:hypothetical protein